MLDPTRTTTLRKQYSADMKRRFETVRRATVRTIYDLDALGLDESKPPVFNNLITNVNLPERQAWRFQTNAQKLDSFNKWFSSQVDQEILTTNVKGDPWTAKWVESAYKKGSIRAYTDAHPETLAPTGEFYLGSRAQFLESAFARPERVSKLKFLYTRSYEDLKGITSAMGQQVSRVMANGIAQGQGPATIARELSQTIDGITRQRALVMARTEIIAAHAEGQLDSFKEMNIEKVGVMAEWSTAADERVCPLCDELDGTVMTVEEARGLIPRHPNCRCAWIPANVGEKRERERRFWSKREKQQRIDRSLKKELPKRTRAGDRVPQTVKEAKSRSTWAGKNVEPKPPPLPSERHLS